MASLIPGFSTQVLCKHTLLFNVSNAYSVAPKLPIATNTQRLQPICNVHNLNKFINTVTRCIDQELTTKYMAKHHDHELHNHV